MFSFRDDLTVEVVFFGEGEGERSGAVTVNNEATGGGKGFVEKPKL